MPEFIKNAKEGPLINNPVNPSENFAEKWQVEHKKEEMFYSWLDKVKSDLDKAVEMNDINQFINMMKPTIGEQLVEKAAALISAPAAPAIHLGDNQKPPKVEIKNPNKPWGFRAF